MTDSTDKTHSTGASAHDAHVQHPATDTEAPNGQGTANVPTEGDTLDRPVLDGASEYYGDEADQINPRKGMADPELIRHPEDAE